MHRKPLLEIPKYTKRPKRSEPKTSITRGRSVKSLPKWSGAKVMLKAKWSTNNLAGHIHYIQHREKNTPKRELITEHGDIHEKDFIKQMNSSGRKYYKFIISPEERLTKKELETVVKESLKELEKHYGKLLYAFVIHENTEHLHAHIVMSAKSKNRSNIRISKKTLFDMKEAAINRIWDIKQAQQVDIIQTIKDALKNLGTDFGRKEEVKLKI